MSASLLFRDFVVYPESDGEPMGETGLHVDASIAMILALKAVLRGRGDVYVGGNMFVYFREGDPKACVCPDVFVVFGTDPHQRRIWKLWEEKRFPDLVVEMVSDSSRVSDASAKVGAYEALGVKEYFLFDPERLSPGPALWGYERHGDRFVRLAPHRLRSGEVRLKSRLLDCSIESDGALLRVRDAQGHAVLRPDELKDAYEREAQAREREAQAREREAQAREREAQARAKAEREVERLRAEIDRLKRRRPR